MGTETHDDAGVYLLSPDLALIQTVDYFTPIVDDPSQFGAIAAANALSDVYAMGGTPRTALNIVGWPQEKLDWDTLTAILKGGHEVIHEAGAVLAGGHSIKSPEVIYGLSITGTIDPRQIVTNAGARPGDRVFLTKPLGTGVLTTALKRGKLEPEYLKTATETMRRLNAGGAEAMREIGVHAATDVTGFGLLGHLLEMVLASSVRVVIDTERVPLLSGALEHARAGDKPGGLGSNRKHVEPHLEIGPTTDPDRYDLLCDPQTSGGLLIAVAAEKADRLADALASHGIAEAAIIGRIEEGTGATRIRIE